jgi:hypothetical protein
MERGSYALEAIPGTSSVSASVAGLSSLAHGMGDLVNSWNVYITGKGLELLGGVYTVCIPTGDTQSSKTKNGYFLSMDDSVDAFAAGVGGRFQLAERLPRNWLSQGNNIIRKISPR